MKIKISNEKLKCILTNRTLNKLCDYYIEFYTTEKGEECYNLYEKINLFVKVFIILTLPIMKLILFFMQEVPESLKEIKNINSVINHNRVYTSNTYKIDELKKLLKY